MSNAGLAPMHEAKSPLARVLEPVDRSSEAIFGVLMAVTITGSLSAATAGRQEIRTLLLTALGCNMAWGFTDAVMYLIGSATEKRRTAMLLQRLRQTTDRQAARRMVADAMPAPFADGLRSETLDEIRQHLVTLPVPERALTRHDCAAALCVFALVVLVTFPVVLPFLFIRDVPTAMQVSHTVALVALYACGHVLGQYTGGKAWRYGLAVAAIGAGLVGVIMALGG